MKNILFTLIISLAAIFTLNSCDNDVELLAPYDSKPVIYGILHIDAETPVDTQWFRINKTFLGQGNLLEYAQIKDSVEYAPGEMNAHLIKKVNGLETDTFPLHAADYLVREPGVLYMENVRAYFTTEPLLNANDNINNITYQLEVYAKGQVYSAETDLGRIALSNSFPNLNLPSLQLANENTYFRPNYTFDSDQNLRRYEINLRFNFIYHLEDNFSASGSILYKAGEVTLATANADQSVALPVDYESFYSFIGNELDKISNLDYVEILNVQIEYVAANDDLTTYIEVNDPVSQIFTESPEFSNIPGALGVFGSKSTRTITKPVNDASVLTFRTGVYTGQYCFCTPTGVAGLYSCGGPQGCF